MFVRLRFLLGGTFVAAQVVAERVSLLTLSNEGEHHRPWAVTIPGPQRDRGATTVCWPGSLIRELLPNFSLIGEDEMVWPPR